MPNKQEKGSEGDLGVDPPSDKDGDDNEFVEVDPTGRYGRYAEVLGKGAFKTVYRAFDEVEGIEVAWNQVKVQDVLQSPEDLERLYSEVHLLKTLKHKNIIKFYNSWVDTKTITFITEIFTSGTLRQYRKKHKHVDIKAVKNWSRQILRGLLYLHSHDPPIIHRDLKCDNVFVNGNQGEVKIGDLGLAAILRQAHAAHSVIGTPEFMAPELYEEEYNELVDIYSFGMCLLEMVTFEYPYSECTNAAQIYKKVSSGKKPAALEKVKDPEVRAFVEKCLATASRRLPARELLMDPFLQCDGDREAIESLPTITLSKTRADDFEELGVICEDRTPSLKAGEFYNSLKVDNDRNHRNERKGREDERSQSGSRRMPALSSGRRSDDEDDPSGSTRYSKDRVRRSSRDFRVKGKRKDDDTIFLRLRIADHDGHSRNIHFPFDIEGDTAMCVASEMVAELDLSDQDVTTIAEMIDAEILALVPEWRPGVAVDDGGLDPDTAYTTAADESEMVGSDDSGIDEPPSSSWKARSISPRMNHVAAASPPRMVEGTMHGRFEEVTYPARASNSRRGSEPIFTSESSDERDDTEDHGSKYEGSPEGGSPTSSSKHGGRSHWSGGFNELVEIRRNAGTSAYSHEPWEVLHQEQEGLDSSIQDELPLSGVDDDDEVISRELEYLAQKQEQELREMHRRHEQAILRLQNRRKGKGASYGSAELGQPISPGSQQTDSSQELFHQALTRNPSMGRSGSNLLSRSDSQKKVGVDSRNGKLQMEEADENNNMEARFVGAPKAYGLGHNLKGHVVLEPSSANKGSYQSDAEGNSHDIPYSLIKSGSTNGEGSSGR
ncbi:hypothetical protein KC19_6G021800 [Ceratodon purpureus]|uniref:non-specific serine/threonine protein kinase n=1 Tax=Ceratodon purpureus TaxID=3225 RepID=A0A8T0H975_CERPU|nr:hypothetical protein KC19_6G021800 [Ceratodon purpureus]KAG0568476.1 hypothetical protein KC19_6G021800 [Ceratodon purpureus]KAG0568477.1 hypothetical protein KC19_6G021800 [Ceratodon purpureus]